MEQPDYAFDVVSRHINSFLSNQVNPGPAGFVSLELGPGDSLASAMIAQAMGGSSSFLIDINDFASADIECYSRMAEFLEQRGLHPANLSCVATRDQALAAWNARFLTSGLESLRQLGDKSVDVAWSHAVLQSVPLNDLEETVRQLRRVLRDGGIMSHVIDLRDMVGGALNHLRFSRQVWESALIRRSGFYTNRVRHGELARLFQRCGFDVIADDLELFPLLPTPVSRMAAEFAATSEEDLRVFSFHVVLRAR